MRQCLLTYLLARSTVPPLCVRPARPYDDLSLPWDLGFEHSMEVWPNKGKGKMLVSAPLRVRWSQAEDTRLVVAALRTLRPDDFSEVLAQVPRHPQHRCTLLLGCSCWGCLTSKEVHLRRHVLAQRRHTLLFVALCLFGL